MKHWHETLRILDRIVRLAEAERQAAVATVTHVRGSAYRRPGAKLLIAGEGEMVGSVSGGCLEEDVREVAQGVLRSGTPKLLHYDTSDDEGTVWGLGLGCNGAVDIFVHPATTPEALKVTARLRELLHGDAPFAVSTIIAGASGLGTVLAIAADGTATGSTGNAALDATIVRRTGELLARGESRVYDVAGATVFSESMVPPPRLYLCGAGDDTRPLAAFAIESGFAVTMLDHRPAFLAPERFAEGTRCIELRSDALDDWRPAPNAYAVVMTHSLTRDRQWVAHFASCGAAYIGVLGPRARTERIVDACGLSLDDRIFGPVGLDVGADGAEQVAISIVAELLAHWSGREPGHLRDRTGAIHA